MSKDILDLSLEGYTVKIIPVTVEANHTLGYSKKWVCLDFNPLGIREIAPADKIYLSSKWCNSCDEWHTVEDSQPTHFVAFEEPTLLAEVKALREENERLSEFDSLIATLTEGEGDSVQILCDNPEAEGPHEYTAIECFGDWTEWKKLRYYGASKIDCLRKAVKSRQALKGTTPSKTDGPKPKKPVYYPYPPIVTGRGKLK